MVRVSVREDNRTNRACSKWQMTVDLERFTPMPLEETALDDVCSSPTEIACMDPVTVCVAPQNVILII
jgi:hypothetical protein